jgi:hypothetical protein
VGLLRKLITLLKLCKATKKFKKKKNMRKSEDKEFKKKTLNILFQLVLLKPRRNLSNPIGLHHNDIVHDQEHAGRDNLQDISNKINQLAYDGGEKKN